MRRTTQTRSVQAPQWRPAFVLKVADGAASLQLGERSGPASAIDQAEAEESLGLAAERVLLTALEVKKAYETTARRTIEDTPLGQSNKPTVEIAPGVLHIPGPWNVTLVCQSDGVVVIEAPISSGYSDKVLADAKKRFPGLPIKAVVSTSDAWPHIGGVREYVARDIPVYALDLNRPILERLVSSPRRFHPDALERQRKKPRFRILSNKTIIGSGPNRIELYPMRTESGERMMMVFFPEHKLLYGSDLVQQRRDETTR